MRSFDKKPTHHFFASHLRHRCVCPRCRLKHQQKKSPLQLKSIIFFPTFLKKNMVTFSMGENWWTDGSFLFESEVHVVRSPFAFSVFEVGVVRHSPVVCRRCETKLDLGESNPGGFGRTLVLKVLKRKNLVDSIWEHFLFMAFMWKHEIYPPKSLPGLWNILRLRNPDIWINGRTPVIEVNRGRLSPVFERDRKSWQFFVHEKNLWGLECLQSQSSWGQGLPSRGCKSWNGDIWTHLFNRPPQRYPSWSILLSFWPNFCL